MQYVRYNECKYKKGVSRHASPAESIGIDIMIRIIISTGLSSTRGFRVKRARQEPSSVFVGLGEGLDMLSRIRDCAKER